MIDALETVIAFVRSDVQITALVDSRVANQHRYGKDNAWTLGDAGIAIRGDLGGQPDLYIPAMVGRYEVRCYASTPHTAMQIWLRLADMARESSRVVVQTANGPALLYYFIARSAAAQIVDDEIGMNVAMGMFEAMVYREALA